MPSTYSERHDEDFGDDGIEPQEETETSYEFGEFWIDIDDFGIAI